jgi:hypothetical protein
MSSTKERDEALAGEAAEKDAAKSSSGKLLLFNQSKNPYHLKDGPPWVEKEVDGKKVKVGTTKRIFHIGASIECLDQEEYDMLSNYKGVGTTKQVAPSLDGRIRQLESEKSVLADEVAALKSQLAKFETHKK